MPRPCLRYKMRQILAFLRHNITHIVRTGIVFLLGFGIYAWMAGDFLREQSIAPHFVYLAQAFLRGQMHLIEPVISSYDLLEYHDRLYVAHQPLPALLMMPFLKFITPINFPDVLFTVLLGAMSVALCDLTLAVMVPGLSQVRRAILTVFFALGTMHGYMSALGTVWFTAQIAATLFLWVFLLGMAWRLPWL
ncbi:MAG TPA: hypothetical protein VJZ27_17730, partial [Aggregatilineales bacterium]|nr:hypothetical protein [Aggregatilineales bacterium]